MAARPRFASDFVEMCAAEAVHVLGCRGDHGQLNGNYLHLEGPLRCAVPVAHSGDRCAYGEPPHLRERWFRRPGGGRKVGISFPLRPSAGKYCTSRSVRGLALGPAGRPRCGQVVYLQCNPQFGGPCAMSLRHEGCQDMSTESEVWGPAKRQKLSGPRKICRGGDALERWPGACIGKKTSHGVRRPAAGISSSDASNGGRTR